MRVRTFLFTALAAGAIGCGITFSPGDYGGGTSADAAPPTNDAGPIGDAFVPVDVVVAPPDTGPPPPAGHIILLGGTKSGGADSNDVWQFPVSAGGDLGSVEYLQSTPLPKHPLAVGLAGGKILSVVQGSSSRVVQLADFANGITSAWTTAVVKSAPTDASGTFFARTSLVDVGGSTTATVTDPDTGEMTTTTTNHVEIYVSALAGTTYPEPNNVKSATSLPEARVNVFAFTYGDYAFLYGDPDRSVLYGGKVDEKSGLASVPIKSTITNPQDGKPHTPTSPIACAGEGHVFIAGGDKDALVLTATIDEAGTIGTWKSGTALPTTLSHAGCAVFKGALYLFGGTAPTPEPNKTDATAKILRARFAADGTMQSWETLPQVLPGARSNVFALTY